MVKQAALWTLRAPGRLLAWLWWVRWEIVVLAVVGLIGYYGEGGALGRGGWDGAIVLVWVFLLAWGVLDAIQGGKRRRNDVDDG
jgi:hypothetical protein